MASASDTTREGEQPTRDIPGEAEHVEDVGSQGAIPQIESLPESEPLSSEISLADSLELGPRVDSAFIERARQLGHQIGVGEELLHRVML